MFDAQVELIGVGCAQVRIHKEHTASAERTERVGEIHRMVDGLGRKWIDASGGAVRIGQEVQRARDRPCARIERREKSCRGKRHLTVKLEVVFCLEDVVEDAEAPTHAGLAVVERLPGKTKSRSEICLA